MASVSDVKLSINLLNSFRNSGRWDDSSSDYTKQENFPLMCSSKDNFSAVNTTRAVHENLEEDFINYLRLLQLASLPTASELEIENPPLPTITPENVNRRDQSQGAAILHYACMNGHQQIVQHLLEQGADVDCPDENKQVTPLMCAAAFGNLDIVELLVECHCDVDAGLQGQSTALLWAIRGSHSETMRFLLHQKASQMSPTAYSETTIHAAVICGSPEILETLLGASSAHSSVDLYMGAEKITPLHLAASGNYPNGESLCKILLEQGNADVKSLNSTNKTPLHLAAASQKPDIVKLLLAYSAPVNVTDDMGKTPLFYAVGDSEDSLRCLQALIQQGKSDVNHQDVRGYTPLHIAGRKGCAEAAEVFLVNGADFSIKANNGGRSALSYLSRKIVDTVTLLQNTFDGAVTVVNSPKSTGEGGRYTSVKINFGFVLPVPNTSNDICRDVESLKQRDTMMKLFSRKETSKIKCLVDEGHSNLLLHPVIHSFLELKWKKAKVIFFPILFFKALLVLLLSVYLLLPPSSALDMTNHTDNSTTTTTTTDYSTIPGLYIVMYVVIGTMAVIQGFMEFVHTLRSPKTNLKTVHPYKSVAVLALIYYIRPECWFTIDDQFQQAIAALGILLIWIDIWIDTSRFPKVGLSIRVFFQVLNNFFRFILPHAFLLVGFLVSFSILFRQDSEFSNVAFSLTKLIRMMAGDITMEKEEQKQLSDFKSMPYVLLIYIYTAYVLIVVIVLGNMLIGLAANDMHAIYSGASIDKLKKQTMLINTLESTFASVPWRMVKSFFNKHINLFETPWVNKVYVFNPFDPTHNDLSPEQKKDLLSTRVSRSSICTDVRLDDVVEMKMANRKNIRIWKDVVTKLRPTTTAGGGSSTPAVFSVHREIPRTKM